MAAPGGAEGLTLAGAEGLGVDGKQRGAQRRSGAASQRRYRHWVAAPRPHGPATPRPHRSASRHGKRSKSVVIKTGIKTRQRDAGGGCTLAQPRLPVPTRLGQARAGLGVAGRDWAAGCSRFHGSASECVGAPSKKSAPESSAGESSAAPAAPAAPTPRVFLAPSADRHPRGRLSM